MRCISVALTLILLVSLSYGPANAQSVMFEYYATLSSRDTYSSQGVPLNDVCAIVQQDRANVHRFGNPDQEEPDPFFTTSERRAMIAGKCDYDRSHHTVERIRSRYIGFVLVRVYGSGGQISRVQIFEAAG